MKEQFEAFATENMGIFRIGSVDCSDFTKMCEKEKVTSFPSVRLYPPFPVPTSDMDLSGDFD